MACETRWRRGRADGAQDLGKCDVEVAQPEGGCILVIVLLLLLGRQPVVQVAHLVRERAMLRRQQQSRQRNPQQAAFQEHSVTRLGQ
jgi:hypothetical protein